MTVNQSISLNEKKSLLIAYLMWGLVFVGIGGMHRFYLGQNKAGALLLVSFGGFGIGQLLDLPTLSDSIKVANGEKAKIVDAAKVNRRKQERIISSAQNTTSGKKPEESRDVDDFDELMADQAELEKNLKNFKK